MIRFLSLLLLFSTLLLSKEFTIASYNVENLFDLTLNKSDYKEYKPNTKANWNRKTFDIKLKNTIKVIKDIDADIIALQEIENKELLKLLQIKLPQYKYISFSKYKNASVGVGFLSKIKIIEEKTIEVKFSNKLFRPILETTFLFENNEFKVFNNHWPSKAVPENYRIKYAKKLFDRVKLLPKDYDYILVGDFNSNYNEYETIFNEKRLNTTNSLTGINHVLNSHIEDRFITKENILKYKEATVHFNPWLEKNIEERFSSKFRGGNVTPDNILLPYSMFDNKKISYVSNSFLIFKPEYLYKNKRVNRWQIKNSVHTGKGYSDHLPILAKFSTSKQEKQNIKEIKRIEDLYKIENLETEVLLKNCIVLLKDDKNIIIKQKDNRAIFIYKKSDELSEGFSYDLTIKKIKTFNGLKEISEFEIKNYKGKIVDYKTLYLDITKINPFDLKNQNELIKEIKGIYNKGYFYFDNKKIAIYFKNREIIPPNGSSIIIKRAQIGYYIDKIQLVIFNKSDIIYVN